MRNLTEEIISEINKGIEKGKTKKTKAENGKDFYFYIRNVNKEEDNLIEKNLVNEINKTLTGAWIGYKGYDRWDNYTSLYLYFNETEEEKEERENLRDWKMNEDY